MESLTLSKQFSETMDIESEKARNNPVIGYQPDGTPIVLRNFVMMIQQAEGEYSRGNFQTIEELDKESESR